MRQRLLVRAAPNAPARPTPLAASATSVRTDVGTGLSPSPTSCCSSLRTQFRLVAARFHPSQFVAACSAGLLIPRSQVRFLPGPSAKLLHGGSFLPRLR